MYRYFLFSAMAVIFLSCQKDQVSSSQTPDIDYNQNIESVELIASSLNDCNCSSNQCCCTIKIVSGISNIKVCASTLSGPGGFPDCGLEPWGCFPSDYWENIKSQTFSSSQSYCINEFDKFLIINTSSTAGIVKVNCSKKGTGGLSNAYSLDAAGSPSLDDRVTLTVDNLCEVGIVDCF